MSIHIETQGQGTDLILLPGWGMNGAVFEAFAGQLASFCRVHVVDLPGYGFTPWHVDYAALPKMLTALERELPAAGYLLGWSLGGMLAWKLALRQPQRWQGVITMASSPRFVASEEWPGVRPMVLAGFEQQLQQESARTVERFLAIQAMGSPSAREDVRQMKMRLESRPAADAAALSAGLTWLESLDLREALSRLQVPSLSLFGRLDGLVPVAVMSQPCLQHPQLRTVCLTNSAHAPFLTEPDAVCQQLQLFMSHPGRE